MTVKDQELIAEAYVNEVFGFGSKPKMIDLKKELRPEDFNIVSNTFKSTPRLREYIQSCNLGSCLIDKNKIPKICNILQSEYDNVSSNDESSDRIIDTHDILASYYHEHEYI